MELGNKVMVTYSNGDQFVGRINGETAESWKIEFDNGEQKTVRKTTTMEVIDDPETEVDETPVETPAAPVEEVVSVTAEELVEAAEEGVGPIEEVKEPTKIRQMKPGWILALILLGMAIVSTLVIIAI